jgi:hypothetical protein
MRRLFLSLLALAALPHAPAGATPPRLTGGAAPVVSPGVDLPGILGPTARVHRDRATGRIRQVFGLAVPASGATPGERALAFLETHGPALGLRADFVVAEVQSPRLVGASGAVIRHIVRLSQVHGGLPVEGRATTVTVDGEGIVRSLTTDDTWLVPPLAAAPRLDAPAAARHVEALYRVTALADNASLVVLPAGDAPARLAWKVPAVAIALAAHFFVWVDAESGATLRTAPAGPDQALATLPLRDPSSGDAR